MNSHESNSGVPGARPRVLWSILDWRCELEGFSRLLLWRGDQPITDHTASSQAEASEYAQLWKAAIEDAMAR